MVVVFFLTDFLTDLTVFFFFIIDIIKTCASNPLSRVCVASSWLQRTPWCPSTEPCSRG